MRVGRMETVKRNLKSGYLNVFADDIRNGWVLEMYSATDNQNVADYVIAAIESSEGIIYEAYSLTYDQYIGKVEIVDFFNIEDIAYRVD